VVWSQWVRVLSSPGFSHYRLSPTFFKRFLAATSRRRGLQYARILQDPQHPPQRLGRTPKQLISHGKRREILAPHFELAQPPDRDLERSRDGDRREVLERLVAAIGDNFDPRVRLGQDLLDLGDRDV